MLDLLTILGSLILCIGILDAIPAMGKHLEKFAKWLGAFQTLIGLIIIILVAISMWEGLLSIIALLIGIILLTGIFPMIPAIGKQLEKFAKWLGSFQTIIGIIGLILGILYLIGMM
jgi:uncharacterized membrane protein HdeD (DUF308 family)